MKKIVAINASPRTSWNTSRLVREAAKGAETEGAEEYYSQIGYDKMLENYKNTLSGMVGPTKIMIIGDTLQVNDYDKYNWTMFDPEAKKARHDEVFSKEMKKAYNLGNDMVKNPWK